MSERRQTDMERRYFLRSVSTTVAVLALLGVSGAALIGCGDAPNNSAIEVPTDPQTAVVRIEWSGGFTTQEWAFRQLPQLVIGGDRRVYTGAPIAEIYPGPLVYPVNQRSLSAQGLQQVMHLAADLGLLAPPPNYDLPDGIGIADAADTVVTLVANGEVFVHRAYALELGGTSTPARDRLSQFVRQVTDLEALVGSAALGAEEPFVPTQYRVRAVEGSIPDPSGIDSTIVPWPTDAGIALADVGECHVIDAEPVRALFAAANELTRFDDGASLWTLTVSTVLPGDSADVWGC